MHLLIITLALNISVCNKSVSDLHVPAAIHLQAVTDADSSLSFPYIITFTSEKVRDVSEIVSSSRPLMKCQMCVHARLISGFVRDPFYSSFLSS